MWTDLILAFVAGFFAGNGLPYYVAGSTGDGVSPSPFPDRPRVNVIVGVIGVGIGAVAWHFVDLARAGAFAYGVAALGVLTVGLIHAGNWRTDPWGKHARER